MSKGRLLVIEGLDGSGNATRAKLLAAHLAESGYIVMEITFPDYESDSSALVEMYLSGQFGEKPASVREIGAAVELKSPATVHFHLKGLEEAGVIVKTEGL